METTKARYTEDEQNIYAKASEYFDGLPTIDEILELAKRIFQHDNPGVTMDRRKDFMYFAESIHYAIHKSDFDFGRIAPKNVLQAVTGRLDVSAIERMIAVNVAPNESTGEIQALKAFMEQCEKLSKAARNLFSKWLEIIVVDPAEISGTLGIVVLETATSLMETAEGNTAMHIAKAIHARNDSPYTVERRNERTGKVLEAISQPDFESSIQTVRAVAKRKGFKMGTHDTCFCYHEQTKAFKPSVKMIVGIYKNGERIINME